MHSKNIKYQSAEDLRKAKKTIVLGNPEQLLIQVFCGTPEEQYISNLLAELVTIFPFSPIIGTTTAGEICDGESQDQSTIISFTQCKNTSIKCALAQQNDDLYEAGKQLVDTAITSETKAALLFGCGIKDKGAINSEPLLSAFQDHCPHVVVAGGQAGDNGQVRATFVFTQEGYTSKGVALAALSGEDLQVNTGYNLSWLPLGKEMTITGAEGNRIHTIDDKPARDIYAHYLGDNISDRLPASAAEFPLVVERSGVMIARHANNVLPDGSLDFMAPFKTGERVRFAYCHSGLVADAARKTFYDYSSYKSEVIFIYSCLSRKWVLGEDTKLELAPLATLAPTSGFFSYGEYFSADDHNLFLSQTMTVIGFSEGEQKTENEHKDFELPDTFPRHETKQIQDLQALHNLVETSSNEREQLIEELSRALAEIKTLRGFIPICASCKKIRDDKGYWKELETYLHEHTEAQFSHGICPSCVKVLYPFMDDNKKNQKEG